jgi:hypothetical protein
MTTAVPTCLTRLVNLQMSLGFASCLAIAPFRPSGCPSPFPESTFWVAENDEIVLVDDLKPNLTSVLKFDDSPPREEYPIRIEAFRLHGVSELPSR